MVRGSLKGDVFVPRCELGWGQNVDGRRWVVALVAGWQVSVAGGGWSVGAQADLVSVFWRASR